MREHLRIVFVSRQWIVSVFNALATGELLGLPHDTGIPTDAKVIEVFDDPHRQSLGVIIEHPSFSPTLPGCEIQILPSPEMRRAKVVDVSHRGDMPSMVMVHPVHRVDADRLLDEQMAFIRARPQTINCMTCKGLGYTVGHHYGEQSYCRACGVREALEAH